MLGCRILVLASFLPHGQSFYSQASFCKGPPPDFPGWGDVSEPFIVTHFASLMFGFRTCFLRVKNWSFAPYLHFHFILCVSAHILADLIQAFVSLVYLSVIAPVFVAARFIAVFSPYPNGKLPHLGSQNFVFILIFQHVGIFFALLWGPYTTGLWPYVSASSLHFGGSPRCWPWF